MDLFHECEIAKKKKKEEEKKHTDGRKQCNKNLWSIKENAVINEYFKFNIQSGTLPGKAIKEEARKRYKILETRNWLLISVKAIIS